MTPSKPSTPDPARLETLARSDRILGPLNPNVPQVIDCWREWPVVFISITRRHNGYTSLGDDEASVWAEAQIYR